MYFVGLLFFITIFVACVGTIALMLANNAARISLALSGKGVLPPVCLILVNGQFDHEMPRSTYHSRVRNGVTLPLAA